MPNKARPTPAPWGPKTHARVGSPDDPICYKLSPADYLTACRAVNREAAGEALAAAASRLLLAVEPQLRAGYEDELLEALAAWEAAGKEGDDD